jgi:hypothetical protein
MNVLRRTLCGLTVSFLLAGPCACATTPERDQFTCKPHQYWLWPGARLPQDIVVDRLYLLQGFFSARNHPARFVDQGHDATRLKHISELVLVYRLDTLQPVSNIVEQFHRDAQSWMEKGNNVIGLQLDFDSATANLQQYDRFLHEIRRSLAARFQLSVTGLLDWINSPLGLTAANEVVFQTYQGRHSVANIERYLAHLLKIQETIPIDFKLGVVQGTTLPTEITDSLSRNPSYQGQVIFLLQRSRNHTRSLDVSGKGRSSNLSQVHRQTH